MEETEGLHWAVFIVRLDRDRRGQITGVIERPRTGEKARVDGQHAGQLGEKWDVKLVPGIHTVTLRYGSATRTERPIAVRFEAEAGHVYRAKAAMDGNRWIVWIEDSKTGEVVAGKKP
jgi:hypothetical protein